MDVEMLLEQRPDLQGRGGGLHLMAEWHACRGALLLLVSNVHVRAACIDAVRDAGLTVVGDCFHVLADGGITGTVVLAESHLAIRTWPAHAAVALDVFVCNHQADNRGRARAVLATLKEAYQPGREELLQVGRHGV
jgi:S-adenosylmethionine decarboxylase proenzyme